MSEKPKTKLGGKREGAGRKPGQMSLVRRAELSALSEMKQLIIKNKDKIIEAQITKAIGVNVLIRVSKVDLSSEVVTDIDVLKQFFNGELNDVTDADYFYMTTRPGDTKAAALLLDRAFGKAVQPIDLEPEVDIDKIIGDLDNDYNPEELPED